MPIPPFVVITSRALGGGGQLDYASLDVAEPIGKVDEVQKVADQGTGCGGSWLSWCGGGRSVRLSTWRRG